MSSLGPVDDRFHVSYKKSYGNGYRYCTRCRAFYKVKSTRCPVCGVILRASPRKRRYVEVRSVRISPELEKELEKIDVKVKIVRRA